MNIAEHPSPIEVWLQKRNMAIKCQLVAEDETTDQVEVDSLSMRGAQREITGWLIAEGYKPSDRWETEEISDDGPIETVRHFKLAS